MAPHAMRVKLFVVLLVASAVVVCRAAAHPGNAAATEHELKFVRLPGIPYAAALSSIVDALPRMLSPAAAAAAVPRRPPTEVASLLKLAQLAPLLAMKAPPAGHDSSSSNRWQRWSAVQGQAELLLQWRRLPMDPTDKGDDRLRGGTPASQRSAPAAGNASASPSRSGHGGSGSGGAALEPERWRVRGGSTVTPHASRAFLRAVPGPAPVPAAATVGSGGVGRPLAVALVAHPVDRCLDALLARWRQVVWPGGKRTAQVPRQAANSETNGTASVLAALASLVQQQGEEGAASGAVPDAVPAGAALRAEQRAALDELVGQVIASSDGGGGAAASVLGDLEDAGSDLEGDAQAPLRCRNEQWRRLRPTPPGLGKGRLKVPFQAGEEWGLTPLLVLAQFDLVCENNPPSNHSAIREIK